MPSSYLVDTSERELEACRRAFPLHVRVSAHCWKKTKTHKKEKAPPKVEQNAYLVGPFSGGGPDVLW